jgi:hypothetical protein
MQVGQIKEKMGQDKSSKSASAHAEKASQQVSACIDGASFHRARVGSAGGQLLQSADA